MKHSRSGRLLLVLLAFAILPDAFIENASVRGTGISPKVSGHTAKRSFANEAKLSPENEEKGREPRSRPRRTFLRRLLALLGCFALWGTSSAVKGYDAASAVEVVSNDQALHSLDALAALAVESVRRSKHEASKDKSEKADKATDLSETAALSVMPQEKVQQNAQAPIPSVPGMDKSNLVIRVSTEPGRANEVMASKTDMTASQLMAETPETILKMIARKGWRVERSQGDERDESFEIFLNPVKYELPLGLLTIPAPHFRATVRDSQRTGPGSYKERLETDLVLQNGEGIVTVSLNFPFSTSFSIGAAGWLRAYIGECEEDVRVRADVEIGLNVPRFPGLGSALQCFVKHYVQRSTFGCATSFKTNA